MAESISQRILNLAYAGQHPQDIANMTGATVPTVLTALANLAIDGATQEQRAINLLYGGHQPPEIAQWLNVNVSQIQTWGGDTTVDPTAGVTWGITSYGPQAVGPASSLPHAADNLYLAAVTFPASQTLNGIAYQLGSFAAGSANSCLFSPSGYPLASSAGMAQANAGTVQYVPFVNPTPVYGQYWAGLQFSSASSTSFDIRPAGPATIASTAAFSTPSQITVPNLASPATVSGVASAVPWFTTY